MKLKLTQTQLITIIFLGAVLLLLAIYTIINSLNNQNNAFQEEVNENKVSQAAANEINIEPWSEAPAYFAEGGFNLPINSTSNWQTKLIPYQYGAQINSWLENEVLQTSIELDASDFPVTDISLNKIEQLSSQSFMIEVNYWIDTVPEGTSSDQLRNSFFVFNYQLQCNETSCLKTGEDFQEEYYLTYANEE